MLLDPDLQGGYLAILHNLYKTQGYSYVANYLGEKAQLSPPYSVFDILYF